MKSFEFKDIDLKNLKLYLKNAFKLMFRRPIYSFIPFGFVIGVIFLLFGLKFDVGIIAMFVIGTSLMPLIAIEFSYSNDFSKIPFKSIEYSNLPVVKEMFIALFKSISKYMILFIVLTILDNVIDLFFPPEVTTKNNENKSSESVLNSPFIEFIMILILSLLISIFSTLGYFVVFIFKLLSLPTLINSVPQEVGLLKEFDKAMYKNKESILRIFFILSFIQSFILFTVPTILGIILWILFTSFGIALCYVIVKDMSGAGSGLEEKKSLLNDIFESNKSLATEQ